MGLSGIWYNELNSKMKLKVIGGKVTGDYVTAVGSADGSYQVVGGTDPAPQSGGTVSRMDGLMGK